MKKRNKEKIELVEKYKKKFIKTTTKIPRKELAVLDDIFFRFYEMGWLGILDKYCKRQTFEKGTCGGCKHFQRIKERRCGKCAKQEYEKDWRGCVTDTPFIPSQSKKACAEYYEERDAD